MNQYRFEEMLRQYQNDFEKNWAIEQQKWIDVKRFQDNYRENCASAEFTKMFSQSLNSSDSIFSSSHYYPIEGLKKIAKEYPDKIQRALSDLFDENDDLIDRVTDFRNQIINLKKRCGLEHFTETHDLRFISALLFFRYPEKYAVYKYNEIKSFSEKFELGYSFDRGNVGTLIDLMDIYDFIIEALHTSGKSILKDYFKKLEDTKFYQDSNLHLFVQNLIWYSEKYNETSVANGTTYKKTQFEHGLLQQSGYLPKIREKGEKTDYIKEEIENTRIGNIGEDFVVDFEISKLIEMNVAGTVERKSASEDGLGYDILSYDESGSPIYIEVKSTNGGEHTMFYITATELEAAKKYGESYRLYRVYVKNGQKAISYYTGPEVEALCNAPAKYAVIP